MIQKLKLAILSLSSLFFLAAAPVALAPAAMAAQSNNITNGVCNGVYTATNGTNTSDCSAVTQDATSNVNAAIKTIINILSVLVGFVAVVMIIVGGFRYITSGGKQESVSTAKNTILYGIIGLVIVALAQLIVQFVLNKSTSI